MLQKHTDIHFGQVAEQRTLKTWCSDFILSTAQRYGLALIACGVLMSVVSSCVQQRDHAADQHIFRYNEPNGIQSLDPAVASYQAALWSTSQLYNGLVELDSNLSIAPCIAQSWDVDEQGLQWTFHLRSDVWFHPDTCFVAAGFAKGTRTVKASDVVFSLKRVYDGSTVSTGAWVYRDRVEDIVAIDDSTVRITLAKPFAPFLAVLTMPYGYIVPHEAIMFYGADFGRHPIGTGPFRFSKWVPDVALELQRNPLYFKRNKEGRRLPYLQGVRITFLRDTKSEFLEFLHDGYDLITSIDGEFAPSVYDAQGKLLPPYQHYQLFRAPAQSVEYYGMLLDTTLPGAKQSPLATNRYLRQALNYAIDRHRIVSYVLHGKGIPTRHGFLPPSLPGYSESVGGYGFDPDKARQLLAQAGYPNGKGLPTLVLQLGHNPRTTSVAEAVQEQWKDVGVNVTLRLVDFPQHLKQVRSGELPMWRTSWIGDYPDPENFLALFVSANRSPEGPNTTHLVSRRLDSLYAKALLPSVPDSIRFGLYQQMEEEIVDQSPWIFLYHDVMVRLAQPNIRGLTIDGTGRLILESVSKH